MSGVERYRKVPITVEAVQLCWRNWNAVCDFLGGAISASNPARFTASYSDTCGEQPAGKEAGWIEITIPTLEGDHLVRHGDYIIKGVHGEFYPCKPDIFAKTYKKAD